MSKSKILVQLDPDDQTSVFDSVVAVDSGADHLFRHQGVTEADVESMVHGAIFTRGPSDLHRTAIFIGGSNVADGERLLDKVKATFFGPMRVSVMLDSNGANTTAAAAVLLAGKHLDLAGTEVAVLGATGPVGQRAARLAARQGARVQVGSRSLERSTAVAERLKAVDDGWSIEPFATDDADWVDQISSSKVLIAAGAAGVELISTDQLQSLSKLKLAIDLNAVPLAGIAGIDVMANGTENNNVIGYGAIGVGGFKMKIHKAALSELFESNEHVLDADEIYDIGSRLI